MKSLLNLLTYINAAALISAASLHGQSFTITPINPPAGAASAVAQGLSNLGEVAGYTTIQVGTAKKATLVRGPAFWWENGSSLVLPPATGKNCAEAHALSETGVVVGISFDIVNGYMSGIRPTRWLRNSDGTFTASDLTPLLPPGPDWELYAISEDGRFISIDDYSTDLGSVL